MAAVLEVARVKGDVRPETDPEAVVEMLIGSYLYRTLAGRPISKNWPERMVAAVWPDGAA
jgi:hypothetical protein